MLVIFFTLQLLIKIVNKKPTLSKFFTDKYYYQLNAIAMTW